MKIIALLASVIFTLFLTSCASNQPITKTGTDTYTLYKVDYAGIFGNAIDLRNSVIAKANTFADQQGKIAVPVSAKTHTMNGLPGNFASFEYTFRLVDKNDKAATQIHLVPGSDVVVDGNGMVLGAGSNLSQPSQVDNLYSELTKLEKLKKDGLLTDSEFQTQKQKLLSNP